MRGVRCPASDELDRAITELLAPSIRQLEESGLLRPSRLIECQFIRSSDSQVLHPPTAAATATSEIRDASRTESALVR